MDAFVKAAVTLVPEALGASDADDGSLPAEGPARGLGSGLGLAAAREEALVGLLCSACSFLVVVPGHPDHGPFYLVTGFLNVLQSAAWRLPASLPTIYLRMLSLFSA